MANLSTIAHSVAAGWRWACTLPGRRIWPRASHPRLSRFAFAPCLVFVLIRFLLHIPLPRATGQFGLGLCSVAYHLILSPWQNTPLSRCWTLTAIIRFSVFYKAADQLTKSCSAQANCPHPPKKSANRPLRKARRTTHPDCCLAFTTTDSLLRRLCETSPSPLAGPCPSFSAGVAWSASVLHA